MARLGGGPRVLPGYTHQVHVALPPPSEPVEQVYAIVPGCPSNEDGTLSVCQWRRVIWAAHLYDIGAVRYFVTSGSAVYTPYVEADALAAGMEALGVPADIILREPNALHTDQNVAYSMRVVATALMSPDEYTAVRIVAASDVGQAKGMCAMARAWRGSVTSPSPGALFDGCTPATLDESYVQARLADPLPPVTTPPVADWVPLSEREAAIAAETGHRRPSSFWVYARGAVLAPFGLSRPPA